MISWRTWTDRLKHSRWAMRVADRLGRGRGRLRVLDRLDNAPPPPLRPDLSGWNGHELAALWVGHATVLLRIGGMNILTDPVFSTRVGIGMGLFTAGPRRHFAPAIKVSELPPLDLILISHAHFDHLDRPTLQKLPKRCPIVTAAHTGDLLADLGYPAVTELGWNESQAVGGVTIRALPVTHWGARTFFDVHRGYNGYLIESAGRRILYAGDTAYQETFRGVGPVDLAIFGISAYAPYRRSHATPEEAWRMAGHLPAAAVLAMHHSTFRLSHEPMEEPRRRFLAAAGAEAEKIVVGEIGEMWGMRGDRG